MLSAQAIAISQHDLGIEIHGHWQLAAAAERMLMCRSCQAHYPTARGLATHARMHKGNSKPKSPAHIPLILAAAFPLPVDRLPRAH